MNLVFYTIIMFSHSFWLTVASIFAIGTLSTIRIGIGFTYMIELVGVPYRTMYGTIWRVLEGMITNYAMVYFWQIN